MTTRQLRTEWELLHLERPIPENELRKMHWRARAEYVAAWRATFGWLAKQARVPRLDAVIVTIATTCRAGTTLPDVGAVFNTAKAAIDGLVDARVIPDDTPAHLRALTFVAPEHSDRDRFLLLLQEHHEGARS